MPSSATPPTSGEGFVDDFGEVATALRTVYDELAPLGLMSSATRPNPAAGVDKIAPAAESVLAAVRAAAISEFGSSRVSVVPGTPWVTGSVSMVTQAARAVEDASDIIDDTPPPAGSGLVTLVLIGIGDSLTAGSAETAAGVTTVDSPEAGFDSVTDPAVDAKVWRDEPGDHNNDGGNGPGFGLLPLEDPYIGTGNRTKQGTNWSRLATNLSTGYVSPGGQPVRVRILMAAKGGSALHPVDTNGGWGGDPTADPPTAGLYDYPHEQYPAFIAAVRAESGYDPAHEKVVCVSTWNNEAGLLVDDAATPTGNQIRETDYSDAIADIPAKLTRILDDASAGFALDGCIISIAGGYANDPQRANMLALRAAQSEGVTRSSGALVAQSTDRLRTSVLADATRLGNGDTNLHTDDKDNLHPSLYGNRVWADDLAPDVASVAGLTAV